MFVGSGSLSLAEVLLSGTTILTQSVDWKDRITRLAEYTGGYRGRSVVGSENELNKGMTAAREGSTGQGEYIFVFRFHQIGKRKRTWGYRYVQYSTSFPRAWAVDLGCYIQ